MEALQNQVQKLKDYVKFLKRKSNEFKAEAYRHNRRTTEHRKEMDELRSVNGKLKKEKLDTTLIRKN